MPRIAGIYAYAKSLFQPTPVQFTNTYTVYQHIYSLPTHIQFTNTYTVYQHIYSLPTHIQFTNTYTVYQHIYSLPTHIQFTNTYTVYQRLDSPTSRSNVISGIQLLLPWRTALPLFL